MDDKAQQHIQKSSSDLTALADSGGRCRTESHLGESLSAVWTIRMMLLNGLTTENALPGARCYLL